MLEVVAHELARYGAQRLMDRCHLCEHICTIAVVLDHSVEPADLPFDSAKARQIPPLRVTVHMHRPLHTRTPLNRRLFPTTLTELRAIAALARTGLSRIPNAGYSTPAAIGIPTAL